MKNESHSTENCVVAYFVYGIFMNHIRLPFSFSCAEK